MNTPNDELHDRIGQFADRWRRLAVEPPLRERLASFFAQAGALPSTRSSRRADERKPAAIDAPLVSALVTALSPSRAAIRARGTYPNPWAAAGLKRDEVRNTSALASLWSEASSGPPAKAFLAAFLHRVSPKTDPLPVHELLRGDYHVRVEDSPLGLGSERIDLTIESDSVLLGVEVKIGAGLGKEQLQRYVDTVRRRAESTKRSHRVILLAPFPSPLAGVVSASWDDVVAASRSASPSMNDRTFAHHLIDRFAKHVSSWKE